MHFQKNSLNFFKNWKQNGIVLIVLKVEFLY